MAMLNWANIACDHRPWLLTVITREMEGKVAGPQTQPWGYLIPEDLYIQVGAR